MTIFGRDSSHYTTNITDANLKGLAFHTCKLTDGLHYYEDSTFKSQTDRAHNIGVPVLGSYHVLWGNKDLAGQADWWLQRVSALTPYWKSMPWLWQPDCESFGYNGLPTIDQINTFGDLICSRAGVPAERYTPYAPAWVYGDKLKSLRYKNYWGSNYGSNPSGHYVTVYPGDASTRWNTYIPMTILQYGSNTDIGDANAFRGTLQQFLDTIKASDTVRITDMPVIVNVTENGGYYMYPDRKWFKAEAHVDAALAAFKMTRADIVKFAKLDDVRNALGPIPGVDVPVDAHGNVIVTSSDTVIKPGTVLNLGTTATVIG
jgi:hypothetical protein